MQNPRPVVPAAGPEPSAGRGVHAPPVRSVDRTPRGCAPPRRGCLAAGAPGPRCTVCAVWLRFVMIVASKSIVRARASSLTARTGLKRRLPTTSTYVARGSLAVTGKRYASTDAGVGGGPRTSGPQRLSPRLPNGVRLLERLRSNGDGCVLTRPPSPIEQRVVTAALLPHDRLVQSFSGSESESWPVASASASMAAMMAACLSDTCCAAFRRASSAS